MKEIPFKARVLGPKAAARLQSKEVTQTLRGQRPPGLRTGDMVIITLDGETLGTVYPFHMDIVNFDGLDIDDARRGGFDNRFELGSALRRAGFRFRPITAYEFYRIQFTWKDLEV